MDKASIVGDAVIYVEDLQRQAKKLKAEIEGLMESSQRRNHSHTANNYCLGATSKMDQKDKINYIRGYSMPALMKILQVHDQSFSDYIYI